MIRLRKKHLAPAFPRWGLGQSMRLGRHFLLTKSDEAIRYAIDFEFAEAP
jgi:hypothetical protein